MSSRPDCFVHGIGTAVPPRALDPQATTELLTQACRNPRTRKLLRRVVRLTGIQKRYLAVLDAQLDDGADSLYLPAEEQPNGPGMGARMALFAEASGRLVESAVGQLSPEFLPGVRTLVTCSCTHASSPGLERPVFERTSVPVNVDRWNLGFMGCSAALAALRLLHQTTAFERDALLVACELSSLHFQYTDQIDQMTANVLFSDGAAALAVSARPSAVRIVDCQCVTLPQAADQMVWFADDHGLRLELSQELPETIGAHLPDAVLGFLDRNALRRDEINHWLTHPGGPQILDQTRDALGLDEDAMALSRDVLRRYGNMSSPTILFILRELIESGAAGRCIATAFGPGLTVELVLFEIDRER